MWSFQTNTVTFYSLGARWVNQPTHEAQQRQVPNIPDIGDGKGEKTKRYIPKQHTRKKERWELEEKSVKLFLIFNAIPILLKPRKYTMLTKSH